MGKWSKYQTLDKKENLNMWWTLLLIGLMAGLISGLVGVGGGVVILPALVIILGFSQKLAQGTTLAVLVPPVGIFAVLVYYKSGNVDIKAAILIALGFILGSVFGAKLVSHLPSIAVSRIFAVFLIMVAVKMLIDAK